MSEAQALQQLAARELASLPRGIGEIHRAISGRVFSALGPAAAPVRVMHDTIAQRRLRERQRRAARDGARADLGRESSPRRGAVRWRWRR